MENTIGKATPLKSIITINVTNQILVKSFDKIISILEKKKDNIKNESQALDGHHDHAIRHGKVEDYGEIIKELIKFKDAIEK